MQGVFSLSPATEKKAQLCCCWARLDQAAGLGLRTTRSTCRSSCPDSGVASMRSKPVGLLHRWQHLHARAIAAPAAEADEGQTRRYGPRPSQRPAETPLGRIACYPGSSILRTSLFPRSRPDQGAVQQRRDHAREAHETQEGGTGFEPIQLSA